MNKYLISFIAIISILFVSGCSSNNPAVKKSDTGICHEEGTNYYKNTKNFTPYNSLDECIKSGGRLPKK